MYKRLLILIICFLLTGCKEITNDNDYISKVNNCLNNNNITNNVSIGYKYYLPKGVTKLKNYDYNHIFLVEDIYLYMYVDIISYYHKKELNNGFVEGAYYYKEFNYLENKGYILILEEDNEYYLNIIYNYSKIESYVPKDKINKIISIATIILNSVEYNDNIISKTLESNIGEFSEFTYEVEKPEGASSNFSHYLEEYVQKDDEQGEQLPGE